MITLAGCSTCRYYSQAVGGHLSLLGRREPIARLLADSRTDPALKSKLELVLEVRHFSGAHLAMPAGRHYLKYADLKRPYVVWNINATPEFSLEARTWWYPVVGRLKYRGFFRERDAMAFAGHLRALGQDVHLGGVEAYSTLGWFPDPVLNTFIHREPTDLAGLLFHELAHQRFFLPGDTDFNEAFATAVAQEAVRQWCQATGRISELRRYEDWVAKERRFVRMIQDARSRLEQLYSNTTSAEPAARRPLKAAVFQSLHEDHARARSEWGGVSPYENWFRLPLNNAQLNSVAAYHDLVPGFQGMLTESEGSWATFFANVKRLSRAPKAERTMELMRRAQPASVRTEP